MKKNIIQLITLALALAGCNPKVQSLECISSSPDSSWQVHTIAVSENNNTDDSAIIISLEKEQQLIEGFGGCFNEMGWEALAILPAEEQEQIIRSLFDSVDGCAFTICRMPLGANDYSVDWYSHNETKDDFEMKNFSLERDRQRLIPYIKKAKTYNPDLKIWASPWCPPSWMKINNHYACAPDVVNDLKEWGRGKELHTQFRMEEKYLSAYALCFAKFIKAYLQEGIEIYAVHVQNELNSCQNFPSCIWAPSDIAEFIGGYLGPRFCKDSLDTEIWMGTIERPQIERIDTILSHPEAKKYIKGMGFQWAGRDAIPDVFKKYRGYKLMQTETECGNGSNDWAAAEHTFSLMKHYFKNGASAYMYWNMVLDETGKSRWGWKQNSMITIDSKTKTVKYNPEFYLMKHLSRFVKPGMRRVETTDENCLAFKNSKSVVLLYYNSGGQTTKQFVAGNICFTAVLSGRSFNTIIIKL